MIYNESITKLRRPSETKLKNIVSSLRRRTLIVKSVVEQPPTPTDVSEEEEVDIAELDKPKELILEDFTESRYASKLSLVDPEIKDNLWRVSGCIDPRGNLYIGINTYFNDLFLYFLLLMF